MPAAAGTLPPLAGMVGVERARVIKQGVLAGTLCRDGDDTVFSYDQNYLVDDAAPEVAVTLPKHDTPVRATAGAVPPFFAGLLPEGARLAAITAAARTSGDDQLTLLLAVGSDTVGDVQVLPAGGPPTHAPPMVDLSTPTTTDFTDLFTRAVTGDPARLDRVALAGEQVKVSASMITTPIGTNTGPAILKLNPAAYPHLVANEHFFLTMAAGCGLPVPHHQLITDARGNAGLLVERFDRHRVDDQWLRLPQEDACQVLGRYPAAKYRLSLHEVAAALADAVADRGGSRPLALRRIVEIAALSYLIGNGDLHGKNLSIRRSPSGLWEISPVYDLLTTQPYLGWRDPMALALYGRANRLGRRWWLDAATRLGLPQRAMARVLDRLVDVSAAWVDRVAEIGFDTATTARLAELIDARRSELAG